MTTWSYDPKTGYPLEIRDAEANAQGYAGMTLRYQTDVDGYTADLIEKQSPEGRRWQFDYTIEGDLASVTDPMGTFTPDEGDYTTTYTYDEVFAILGLGIGAYCLVLAGVGRLMLWLRRKDLPPAREVFSPLERGNPHQGAFALLAHMLRPGAILVVVGIAAGLLRGVSELIQAFSGVAIG